MFVALRDGNQGVVFDEIIMLVTYFDDNDKLNFFQCKIGFNILTHFQKSTDWPKGHGIKKRIKIHNSPVL